MVFLEFPEFLPRAALVHGEYFVAMGKPRRKLHHCRVSSFSGRWNHHQLSPAAIRRTLERHNL